MSRVLLRTEELTKSFGGLRAVDGVNLSVEEGRIHAVIGPNGAGKTTLFNLITGVLKPDRGRIYFEEKDITGFPPYRLSHMGIARSFQIFTLFQNLTVLESIRLAVQAKHPRASRDFYRKASSYKDITWEAMKISATVGLWSKNNLLVSSLTPSDKRKLEVAMALAGKPRLLALDEPTAGISVEELEGVVKLIANVKEKEKLTILIIEHKIDVILKIADKVTVMDRGRIIAEGSPGEIVENEEVKKIYLGR